MRVLGAIVALAATLLGGCSPSALETNKRPPHPGSGDWNDADIACSDDADCVEGEGCQDGVCQMKRCGDAGYESVAPMGVRHTFGVDQELAVLGGTSSVHGFAGEDGASLGAWAAEGMAIVDIAGGDLYGSRPHAKIAAVEFSDVVHIETADGPRTLSIGIWPIAIATGDVDADGLDELVALGSDGTLSVCHADEDRCDVFTLGNSIGRDIAVADVDGDGYEEPILSVLMDGNAALVAWNLDAEKTGQDTTVAWGVSSEVAAITAGDLDGDGLAEILLLQQGEWLNEDVLAIFSPIQEAVIGSPEIGSGAVDLVAMDRDGDGKEEVGVLSDDGTLRVWRSNAPGTLAQLWSTSQNVDTGARHLAALDWDGDSPLGRLVSGPELVSGNVVPTTLLMFPPYYRSYAEGDATVSMGSSESQSESLEDSVSLWIWLTLTYEVDVAEVFSANVSTYLMAEHEVTKDITKGFELGQDFGVTAKPSKFGDDYAAIILSCGCFHAYTYETDDPAGRMGGSGHRVTLYVPVGGQTALWSTKRYNALARARGDLPVVSVPYRVGDASSYPTSPVTLAGSPIPDDDRVFPASPSFQVSDVGEISWSLSASEEETNGVADSIDLGVGAGLGLFGVKASGDVYVGLTRTYSVTVGKEAHFEGTVPAIEDDPATSVDEFQSHRYSFSPIVYREHYPGAEADAGFFVVSYAVGP